MASRLDGVADWEERARSARYFATRLADQCGVSRRQLNRFFLTEFKIPTKQWLEQRQRVDSLRWLKSGALIKEISEHLGFATASGFTRAFNGWYGVPPREFLRIATVANLEKGVNVPDWIEMSQNGQLLLSSSNHSIGR